MVESLLTSSPIKLLQHWTNILQKYMYYSNLPPWPYGHLEIRAVSTKRLPEGSVRQGRFEPPVVVRVVRLKEAAGKLGGEVQSSPSP